MGEWAGKRVFDFSGAFLGLVILVPVFLAVALAIKIGSKGPVFFRQERVGKNGKIFLIYKFRTMVSNAPDMGQHFTTQANDSRITRTGGFLRKFNIDEIPQLINIVAGDMGIVGPRPEVPEIVELYDSVQKTALSVRPGLTDYASLRFRKEGEILAGSSDLRSDYVNKILPEKTALQLQYVREASMATDIKIILQTILSILKDIL